MEDNISPFMTPKEAMDFYRVSMKTILRWVKDKRIRAEQPAGTHGRIRITREELPWRR